MTGRNGTMRLSRKKGTSGQFGPKSLYHQMAPIDSVTRYTFGITSLKSGLSLLPLTIGFFAVTELMKNAKRKFAIAQEDIILKKVCSKGAAVVIGTGNTGIECAEMLLDDGAKVTMVDMLDSVGKGIYPVVLNDLMDRVKKHDPTILLRHKLLEITDDGVLVENAETGERNAIQADTVCLSLGSAPIKSLAESFRVAFEKVIVIGSAEKDGRIHDASKQGYIKGFVFE